MGQKKLAIKRAGHINKGFFTRKSMAVFSMLTRVFLQENLIIIIIIIIMEFIKRLYIAVLSALQCTKGHKNIIKHKLTYNPTVHILKRKEKQTNKQKKTKQNKKQNKIKNKNKNKYDETKCHIPLNLLRFFPSSQKTVAVITR